MDDPLGLLGTTIAEKYRVERVLGQGGFGVVYAGMQMLLRQPVAIKLIKPGAPGSTAFTAATFLREAKLLFGLTHPGIVRMYDVGEAKTSLGPAPYVVLELIEGTTLAEEIGKRRRGHAPPFGSAELRAIFEPVIDALAFAHARGIVHRDLKPANIMVIGSGPTMTAKVLDFGLADGAPDIAITSGGGLTPLYAAPEQWNSQFGTVGPATDVFALGLCIEEAVTLAPAVEGDSIPAIVASATNPTRASRIAAARPDLPRTLEHVVVRATRVRPPDRFASASDLLAALRTALSPGIHIPPAPALQSVPPISNAPISPYAATYGTSSAIPRPAPAPAFTPPPPAMPAPAPAPAKSNVALFVGLIVGGFLFLGLLITAIAAFVLLHSDEEEKPVAVVVDASAPTTTVDAGVRPSSTTTTATTTTTTPKPPVPVPPTPARDAGPAPPDPNPNPTPGVATFAVTTGERTGIDPDFPKFNAVVVQYGPGLEQCFRQQQAVGPEWSATMNVLFSKDGGRGGKAIVRNKGVDQTSMQAEQIKDCIYGTMARWPWPRPPGFDYLDGGYPRLAVHMRWDKK